MQTDGPEGDANTVMRLKTVGSKATVKWWNESLLYRVFQKNGTPVLFLW